MAETIPGAGPIKLVTLDLDNTLWPVEPVILDADRKTRDWLEAQTPGFDGSLTNTDLAAHREAILREQPALAHDLSKLRIETMHRALLAFGVEARQARTLAIEAFDIFIEARHEVTLYPGVEGLLQGLSERYPLAALSNGNADVSRLPIAPAFSFSCSSADVGASKPSPEMFLSALERLSLAPEEAVHVGDSLKHDIAGANAVGMHTVWLDWHGESLAAEPAAQPSRRIRDIRELDQCLTELSQALSGSGQPHRTL